MSAFPFEARSVRLALLLGALAGLSGCQRAAPELRPIVYTIRVPSPERQTAEVEARIPTEGRAVVELMMPVWSPGFYRIQDYASKVEEVFVRTELGAGLRWEESEPNRWRVETGSAPEIVVSYELACEDRFVTTNWVSPELGVLNGGATWITLFGDSARPHEVRIEPPPGWTDVETALPTAPDGRPLHFRAESFDELVDSPIVGGDLDVHVFHVAGIPHSLVNAGDHAGFDGEQAARDLQRIVERSLPLWGTLPYHRYVFLNVFRPGGGGLEHASSTLLTASVAGTATHEGYRRWLAIAAHEYVHALNVKRLRPVELGPFDYEQGARTPSLWFSEGVTSYLADILVTRAGLADTAWFLDRLSSQIASLQSSPGRHLQSVSLSSLEVWGNSNSGIGADSSTVSYYVKGQVIGFLLDARIRSATDGRRSLDDLITLAYQRYGGQRGFTPEELVSTAEEVAEADQKAWFRTALETTEELDYSEALTWFGLRFAPGRVWTLEIEPEASSVQEAHLRELLAPAAAAL
jgi:predicted metalloprotease with PDZ domain